MEKKIMRQTYNKSFLKNIQSLFSFDPVDWSVDVKQQFISLFEQMGFVCENTGNATPFVQGKKGGSVVAVTDKGVILSMDIKDYVGFETYQQYIDLVITVLSILKCDKLKNFVFQKLNYYRLSKSSETENITEEIAYKALFSKEMLSHLPMMTDASADYIFAAQPYFKVTGENIAVKLLVSAMRVTEVSIVNLKQELSECNDQIFALWYKATTERIRKVMEE